MSATRETLTHAPVNQLLLEVALSNACSALRNAARLTGELRACRKCGEDVCVFSVGGRHLVYTAATAIEHATECLGLPAKEHGKL